MRQLWAWQLLPFWAATCMWSPGLGHWAWAWAERESGRRLFLDLFTECVAFSLLPGQDSWWPLGGRASQQVTCHPGGLATGALWPEGFLLPTSCLSDLCLNLWLVDFKMEMKVEGLFTWEVVWLSGSCWYLEGAAEGREQYGATLCLSEGDLHAGDSDNWG